MSFEDDLRKLGDDVSNLVDNAVNSQNFQQLNQKITDSINQFIYPRRNSGQRFDPPPEDGPYQQQERRYRKPDSMNGKPYDTARQASYSRRSRSYDDRRANPPGRY